jgi:peptidoglycan hydrolase CwlO-like protein
MIRVQQIADLEARVLRAIDLIERLRTENRTLNASLESAEQRSRDLEIMLENLRGDQQNVEQIILRTLNKLDGLEDAWAELQQRDQPAAPPADTSASPPDPPPSPPGSDVSGTGLSSLGTGGP